jgi:hypothetical protein
VDLSAIALVSCRHQAINRCSPDRAEIKDFTKRIRAKIARGELSAPGELLKENIKKGRPEKGSSERPFLSNLGISPGCQRGLTDRT